MFPVFRHFSTVLLIAIALFANPASAMAGWMGFRNDSNTTLIVQETVTVGSKTRPGTPQKIFANETVRDTPPSGSSQRKYTIFDAAHPEKAIFTGSLACPAPNENVLYVLKSDGRGGLVIEAVRSTTTLTKTPPKK